MKRNLIVILSIIIVLFGAGTGCANKNKKPNPSLSPAPVAQATYTCDGGKTIQADFYKGEPKPVKLGETPIPTGSVNLVLSDGRNLNLVQTISADGVRYANSDESFVFWSKGDGALVLENNVAKDYVGCVVVGKQAEVQGIKVISPNGGEDWSKGQKVQITWSATKDIKFVNIRLAISGNPDAQNFNAAIASGIPNTGSYEWTVQDLYAEVLGIKGLPASDKYLVTIEDSDHNNIWDSSDATFSINTNQTQNSCNTNSDCQNGASCMVTGPLIAGQPVHKVCVPKGQAVPL